MSYKFVRKPLEQGLYEPEGIYLDIPFQETVTFVQSWGSAPEFYAQYQYSGIALKGYIGAGFDVSPQTAVHAMDDGRVSEINMELGGFERYIKVDHWWGESVYARVNGIQVESGQLINRGAPLAASGRTGKAGEPFSQRFHMGIRIRPYNRFDGWGGFSDPLPYLDPERMRTYFNWIDVNKTNPVPPLPMAHEKENMRRP